MNKNSNNIILTGFMGCGKTTFGKWIKDQYGRDFMDTDEYIEDTQKMTINDIFKTKGESAFRDMETDTIREFIGNLSNTVLSVGGGLPVRDVNRELLKELGCVVYLKTDKAELVRRLQNDNTRPLLAGGDLEKKIEELMGKREALYRAGADIIIDTDGKNFEKMYAEIEQAINAECG